MSSWRDHVTIHPAAELFPLMSDAELLELGEDIKQNGLTSPIAIMVENGNAVLVDGRNRLDAIERVVGLRVYFELWDRWQLSTYELINGEWVTSTILDQRIRATLTVIDGDPVKYIASVNIHRRHLTAETKRELIAKLLKEHPERSDRATADLVQVDGKTVAAVRRELEDVRSIPHVEKRVDTKGRKQPASKAVRVEDKKGEATKQTVRRFCEAMHELHSRLNDLHPDAVELVLAKQEKDKVFRQRVAGVVSGLSDLIAKIDASSAKREQAKAKATPPDPHDGVMPDIPACLDRRPSAPNNSLHADEAKTEAAG